MKTVIKRFFGWLILLNIIPIIVILINILQENNFPIIAAYFAGWVGNLVIGLFFGFIALLFWLFN